MYQRTDIRLGICVAILLYFVTGCAVAPFNYPRESSTALGRTMDTALKRMVDVWSGDNAGPSGFYPLSSGRHALGARLRLMELAEVSLDVQYFLIKADTASEIFACGLLAAANRGVRVRFLLDDSFSTMPDELRLQLAAHSNIELRLYNPISRKGIRSLNVVADFKRANRRMHNKSLTADSQVSIVGGRDIGDEYFELSFDREFLDLDVFAIGPVAADVSALFDQFWNRRRSVPMEAFAGDFTFAKSADTRLAVDNCAQWKHRLEYRSAVDAELVHGLFNDGRPFYSASARVLADSPDKLLSANPGDEMQLLPNLIEIIDAATDEVIIMNPYFIPGSEGIGYWKAIVEKGVRVVLITNSLESNNHLAVHAAYAKYRSKLIEVGVELYELRANASTLGAAQLTLHTKALIIDRRSAFIGSLNLDPRSIVANTEMGIFIPNHDFAAKMAEQAMQLAATVAYRVDLNSRRQLRWRAVLDGVETVEMSEPGTSRWRRLKTLFSRIVPEAWL